MEQLNPGLPVYNESEAVRLRGELNVDAMEQALNAIVARHEMLRTTIQDKADKPWRSSAKLAAAIKEDRSECAGHPATRGGSRTSADRRADGSHTVFEMEPGIRATLIRLGPRRTCLHPDDAPHHLRLVLRGRFVAGVVITVSQLFPGEPLALPPLPIQDGDYAVWQRQQLPEASFAEDLAFWEENLSGAPALLELPSDRPRPPVMSYRGAGNASGSTRP